MSFSNHKNTTNELDLGIQLSRKATGKYFFWGKWGWEQRSSGPEESEERVGRENRNR